LRLKKIEEEGLHWCVQAATPQRTPGIPESCEQLKKIEEEEGLHWCQKNCYFVVIFMQVDEHDL
jgi:hypothetical protein